MKHSTGTPTKIEAKRKDAIKDIAVCVCCRLRSRIVHLSPHGYVDVHHLLKGNKRIGHMHTIGLCVWHHRGHTLDGYNRIQMQALYGHSLAHGSKPFREQFGSDEDLLALQDEMLDPALCVR